MKRLYYLTDQLDHASHISDHLTDNGITDRHIHVLTKDEAGLVTRHLHGANYFQRLDLIRSTERGFFFGLAMGALVLALINMQPGVAEILGTAVLAITFAIVTLFFTWIGGMVGISHENYKIARFHDAIEEENQHLIMIDIRRRDESRVKKMIEFLHEGEFAGSDSTLVMPFGRS